ncbi:MAG: DUF3662 and FHA domain-containing protein [Actinomycetota bacterium]|jgi:hypothetical protein|nr:DUF3662 and FHA domain-containing protein [Actinomycetota bacterium]
MGLKGFERRLERLVEGAFSRAFRSGLRPIELGRKVGRLLDDERTVDVRGRTVVPNRLLFSLASDDHERFAQIEEALRREIAEVANEHAQERGYGFMGPIKVEFEVDESFRSGRFELVGELSEAPAVGADAGLIDERGSRVDLVTPFILGRHDDCDLTLAGTNVSRRHAEIRTDVDGLFIADLASTNGTLVNGLAITSQRLGHGDIITVGDHHLRLEVG